MWLVGTDGFAYGTTGEGAVAGAVMHAHLLEFMKTATLPSPARVVTQLTGGNRWLGQVMFGPANFGTFSMTSADMDSVAMALSGGSTPDVTTNSRWRRVAPNINRVVLPSVGLMLTTIYQSREEDSDGVDLYVNYVIPRCQCDIALPGMSYQAENAANWTVTPRLATKEPHGLPFASGAMGLHRNKALMYAIISPKPLALTTAIGETDETTFTLGYLPASSVVTLGNTPNEHVKNGVKVAASGVNTTTGVVTTAAQVNLDKHGMFYETDFVQAA
jgi:hypothetical protein